MIGPLPGVSTKWTMPTKRVSMYGQPTILACDGRCDKAWGIQARPRKKLSADEDDYVYKPDSALGRAPAPGKTAILSEGGDIKPSASALGENDGDRMNRWCARQCERCERCKPEEPIKLRDMEHPEPNIPRS